MSFLNFLKAKAALGEGMMDSDLITAFSLEIPADTDPTEVAMAARETAEQIIAASKFGQVNLVAVVMSEPRRIDN